MTRRRAGWICLLFVAACEPNIGRVSGEGRPRPSAQHDDYEKDAGSTDTLKVDANVADAHGLPETPAPATCSPVRQDCGDEQRCVVELSPSPVCVPSTPSDLHRAAPCEHGECAHGLACVLLTESSTAAVCEQICDLDLGIGCASLGNDFECRARIEDTPWGACVRLAPTCDPLTQAPCAPEEACHPFLRRTGAWDFRCRPAGTGLDGERCDGQHPGCIRKNVCVSTPEGIGICRTLCKMNADCETPKQCVGLVDEPPFRFCVL